MPAFAIESAVSRTGSDGSGGELRAFRTLEIEGPANGPSRNRACLIFSDVVDPARTAPVGYVARDADGGVSLVGWLPEAAYAACRDAVATGEAVEIHYETRHDTIGYLRRIALGRSDGSVFAAGGQPNAAHGSPESERTAFAMPL
jgi:hypothetical protein